MRGFGRGSTVCGSAYRSGGVVSKAAYRAGERLHNHEQASVYDFTARAESVTETLILAPPLTPLGSRRWSSEMADRDWWQLDGGAHYREWRPGSVRLNWHKRLVCAQCGSRNVDYVVSGTKRRRCRIKAWTPPES